MTDQMAREHVEGPTERSVPAAQVGAAQDQGSVRPGDTPAVRQLDAIIEDLAGYAVPVLREIAARAAELAARAGEAAGPMAHKAADTTERVGDRLATKGREFASDFRRDATPAPINPPTTHPETQEPIAIEAGLPPR